MKGVRGKLLWEPWRLTVDVVLSSLQSFSACLFPTTARGFPPSNVALRRNTDYYNTLEELIT